MTTRKQQAKQTKKKLLNSAIELISTYGYQHVTVDKIVEYSGVSKGTFYIYFKSKHEIFLHIFDEMDHFYKTFTKMLPNHLSAAEKIIKLTEGQMEYISGTIGKELVRVIYLSNPESQSHLSKTDRLIYQLVNSYVCQGQENEEFTMAYDSEEMTLLITTWMRGGIYDWAISSHNNLTNQSVKQVKILLRALKK
ncbi:TetR/AcrR family transcriptional regulator [Alteribacillus sp. YIM 98480]|uniref:TetR/AcrR family transcriptional regulator n=1 Tax=Alteribacillus sp. YIM 98480 TaxID=2606599 RepID=UPI00131E899C|nr:TetR/AcrR family transcriptional regulator [Alteribacillus sp. YIM 98480]